MPEENKGIGGLLGGNKSADKPESDSSKPEAEVSETEAASISGPGGRGGVPAFAEGGGKDENDPLTSVETLEDLKEGAAEQSNVTDPELAAKIEATLLGVPGEKPDDGSTEYIASGIAKLKIGRFQFEGGRLNVKGKDVEAFEKCLAGAHPRTQQAVKKIDRAGGEAIARAFRAGRLSRGVDTSESGVPSPEPSQS